MNELHPVAIGFEKVKVVVLVSTVPETTLPSVRSMSCVPPPIEPMAFTLSE